MNFFAAKPQIQDDMTECVLKHDNKTDIGSKQQLVDEHGEIFHQTPLVEGQKEKAAITVQIEAEIDCHEDVEVQSGEASRTVTESSFP